MPDIPLAPSGGITDETAPALLRAGALALNVGSWLTQPVNPDSIREKALRIRAAVDDAGGS
jgi:2-keto-3-deoxy-6-phosphogluconate aldolase